MVNDAFKLCLSLFRFTSQARKIYFNVSSLSCIIPVGLYLSLHASNKLHHVTFFFSFSIHFIWLTTFKYLDRIKHSQNMICKFLCSNFIYVQSKIIRNIYPTYHQTMKGLHWLKSRLIYNTGRKMMINEFWKRKGSIC